MSKEVCLELSRNLFNYLELKTIEMSEKEKRAIYLEETIIRILKEEQKKGDKK